jgi:hypothetical protein
MSEHGSHQAEKHERKTSVETHEVEASRHHEHEKHQEVGEHAKQPNKHELERRIHKEAKSRHETHIGGQEQEAQAQSSFAAHKDIKTQAYNQVLRKARSHLKPAERKFSKVIHQPVVETVSELSGKTLARPSAILGGGITAFIGSGTILYMSKHYGFEYNFFIYILFLLVGFGVGIVLEFLVSGVRSKH